MISLAFLMLMNSCVDDTFNTDEPKGGLEIDEEGYGLALHISLESMTRGGDTAEFEDDEDFVDPSKLSLLFFYSTPDKPTQDNTLIKQFISSDLSFIPIRSTLDGTLKNWYVRIKQIDEEFADIVRNNNFKVAVLANWNVPMFTKGEHINKLHHLSTSDPYLTGDKKDVYGFLEDHRYSGALGLYTKWVENKFEDVSAAEREIKGSWYPGYTYKNPVKEGMIINPNDESRPYKDLRLLWYFNAAYTYNPSEDPSNKYDASKDWEGLDVCNPTEWAKRNYKQLHDWLVAGYRVNDTDRNFLNNLEPYTPDKEYYDNGCFEFVRKYQQKSTDSENTDEGAHTGELPQADAYVDYKDNKYCVVLPESPDYQENAIKINMTSSGYVEIEWEPLDSRVETELTVETRNIPVSSKTSQQEKFTDPKNTKFARKITNDIEYMSIYCSKGKAAIYAINYVKDEYLYQTARRGVYVSSLNPIPMYGVQEYKKLENYWKKGTLFNLSNFNHISSSDSYDSKEVSLLRSVSKVELKIPKNFNAHHVYLRCQNRFSRNEPMDVITPTNDLWLDDVNGSHNLKCEWFTLKKMPTFYEENQVIKDNYQQKLAWYYGTWANNDKKLGEVPIYSEWLNQPDEKGVTEPDAFPHIMNPMIDRTDFTEFIYTGTSEGLYDRYVLYVPEKFVDDPNSVYKGPKDGKYMENESPKVCHIEFRRGEDTSNFYYEDPYDNVDDNNHYRVYFIDKGYNADQNLIPDFTKKDKDSGVSETWERKYEQNQENLKKHWPILRNHVYGVTVQDSEHKIVIVKIEVLPWKNVDNNVYEW